MTMEKYAEAGFGLFLTVLPIRYIIQSFRDPGVLFSSSDYQLMLLPYSKEKLWIIIFAWKWVKSIVIYAAAALLIGVMTPISASVIIAYVVLIAAYDLLMAVPQWKLFSQSWQIKLGFLFAAIAVNAAAGLFTQPYIAAGLVFAIFLIAVLVIQNMFRGIQWQKVTDASDFQIWRMPLIGYAAKTKFKRRRNHSMFPGHSRRKKPFVSNQAIFHRMWRVYFGKNMESAVQTIGVLVLMLTLLMVLHDHLFPIGVAVAIYTYTSIAASFYTDRMRSDILHVLPWNLEGYRQSYFIWVAAGGIFLFVPILIFHYVHFTLWSPLNLVFYCVVFSYIYNIKIEKSMAILAKQPARFEIAESMAVCFLILTAFSGTYPVLTGGAVLAAFLQFKKT